MKLRKILLIAALILLIGFVFFVYNGFNGNPFSKFLAEKELETYLKETYPDQEFTVSDGFYNFKNSGYEFKVTDIGDTGPRGVAETYNFTVVGFIFPKVSYDEIYIENLDGRLARLLNQQFVEEVTPLITERVDSLLLVEAYIEVLKGTYPDDTKWSKELIFEEPMDIFIQLDSSNQTASDFLADSIEIKKILDEQGYHYGSINFNGIAFDFEGKDESSYYLKYSVSVAKDKEIKERNVEEHNQSIWK